MTSRHGVDSRPLLERLRTPGTLAACAAGLPSRFAEQNFKEVFHETILLALQHYWRLSRS